MIATHKKEENKEALLKMTVFWFAAPCCLVEVYQCFRILAASIIRAIRNSTDKILL
jgi:hypothetical protein